MQQVWLILEVPAEGFRLNCARPDDASETLHKLDAVDAETAIAQAVRIAARRQLRVTALMPLDGKVVLIVDDSSSA